MSACGQASPARRRRARRRSIALTIERRIVRHRTIRAHGDDVRAAPWRAAPAGSGSPARGARRRRSAPSVASRRGRTPSRDSSTRRSCRRPRRRATRWPSRPRPTPGSSASRSRPDRRARRHARVAEVVGKRARHGADLGEACSARPRRRRRSCRRAAAASSHTDRIVGGAESKTRTGTPRTSISVIANGAPAAIISCQTAR